MNLIKWLTVAVRFGGLVNENYIKTKQRLQIKLLSTVCRHRFWKYKYGGNKHGITTNYLWI